MIGDVVVMITGAAGRIGSEIAKNIVSQDGKAIFVDVSEEGLAESTRGLDEKEFIAIVADAGDPEAAGRCIRAGVEKFGRVDAAIHAAYPRSAGWGTKFENIQKKHLSEDLNNNLGGAILFSKTLLEFFKYQGHGNLIHISSIMGVVTPKFENYAGTEMTSPVEYTAIKAALIAVTKYLAKYYKGNNVRVNCISPGGILDHQPESFLAAYRSCCNDKGMLDVDDLVGTAMFLLSDQSRFVTGQNIIVDDGWSL
ncbi:MAG: short-chain dehydrogenase [Rhodobacteraceae bacterium]|nr:short-chain dehydrogenase [Paracoccaceae bacterium]